MRIYLKKNNRIKYCLLLFFVFQVILFGKSENYEVSFLGIPVVDVEISEIELANHSKKITFHTKTNSIFYLIYKVDNYYTMILDANYKSVISYSKEIDQKGFKQSYQVIFKNDSAYYSNGLKGKCKLPVQNILGLIIELQYLNAEEVDNSIIEHEGEIYKSSVKKVIDESNKNHTTYQLIMDKIGGKKFLEETDIYSWKIADSTAIRKVIYSNKKPLIIGAKFKFGKLTLSAKRVEAVK
ncbi:MAG: hypothetical protein U9N76_01135 [Candidatus Marinimicrobia bacterium]|nr:hypothetical protein [Candidatus Neomarinimicrobiota bacterium]